MENHRDKTAEKDTPESLLHGEILKPLCLHQIISLALVTNASMALTWQAVPSVLCLVRFTKIMQKHNDTMVTELVSTQCRTVERISLPWIFHIVIRLKLWNKSLPSGFCSFPKALENNTWFIVLLG